MEHFVKLLEEGYSRLKQNEKQVISLEADRRIAKDFGNEFDFSESQLESMANDIENAEVDMKMAIRDFNRHGKIEYGDIETFAHHLLSRYEQNSRVMIGGAPILDMFSEELGKIENVSCVARYNGQVFDPRDIEK